MTTSVALQSWLANKLYIGNAGASKARSQLAAEEILTELEKQGFLTQPIKPTVLVVRHPDAATEVDVSPSQDAINLIEVDLGSSFDGKPDPRDPDEVEVAREIIRELREGTKHLPEDDSVRQSALGWAASLAEGLPAEIVEVEND